MKTVSASVGLRMGSRAWGRILPGIVLLFVSWANAANPAAVTDEQRREIEQALPAKAQVQPTKPRRLLIFSRNVGYGGHRPSRAFACEAFTLMGKKTGAFETVITEDPAIFERESLQQFDAVFLNNTIGNTVSDPRLRQNLLEFVTGGGGLMGVHGTSIAFMDWQWPPIESWPEFGNMIGARGAYHRDDKEHVWIKIDEPEHPLNRAFGGQGFDRHDEFFRYHAPYSRQLNRVLLTMDVAKTDLSGIKPDENLLRDDHDYAIAWIRNYGQGRVFYCSLAHSESVFLDSKMLQFYLDAAQFALGDLKVPTTPSAKLSPAVRAWEKLGWRLGIEAYTFHKHTFFETIEKTAELGLPYIGGLSFMQQVSKDMPKDFNQHLSDDELRQIRMKMEEGGVRMLTYYAQNIPNDEAGCRTLFEFGRKMGIETFMCEPKLEQLDMLDRFANEYGINVAIHNHGQNISPLYWRPQDVLKACQGRSKRIGAAPDLGYWIRAGIDPVEGIRILNDRLMTLQMHDLHKSGPDGHDVPWGTGAGKSEEVFSEMQRLGLKPTMIGLEFSHNFTGSMPEVRKCIEFFNATAIKLAGQSPVLPTPSASLETVKDADGNVYSTVNIGNQVWTVENLRTTKYNDGTPIPHVADGEQWKSIATPAYCYYKNNPEHAKKYGVLYNWYAASSEQIAPKGWRVPTREEQLALRDYLIANGYNCDGTTEGNKVAKSMAAKTNWPYKEQDAWGNPAPDLAGMVGNNPQTNNRSGFSALPAGCRWSDGSFHAGETSDYWWSVTPYSDSSGYHTSMHTWFANYGDNKHNKRSGFSIRLIRDDAEQAAQTAPAASVHEGLVAYWPLDTLSTTTPDLSGNGNHLRALNLTTADVVPGKRGNAISFNGTNSLLLCNTANGSGLPASSHPACTVAMWVKGRTAAETGRVFSETTNARDPLVAISTDGRAPKGVVDLYMRADNGNTLVSHHRTSLTAFDDAWHHIAWVDDRENSRLYVDGVLDTNSCTYTRQPITPTITALGGVMREDAVCFAFQGLIDEAAVWSRALTEAELRSVMTNGLDNNAYSHNPIAAAGQQPNTAYNSAFGDPDKIDVLVVTGGLGIDRDPFFAIFDDCPDIKCVEFPLTDESEVFEDISDWKYDVLLLYNATEKISQKRRDNFVSLLKDKGIGLVVVHHAQAAYQSWLEFHKINGSAFIYYDVTIDGKPWPHSKCKGGMDIPVTIFDTQHPITRGLTDFRVLDETYKGRWWADDNHVLLTTDHPDNDTPIAWTRQYGKSRVFNIQLGHDYHTYEVPQYRDLIIRSIRWTDGTGTQGGASAGHSAGESTDTVQDGDGNVYHTVRLGNQVWTVENLRTTKFNDGTPIPHVTDAAGWRGLASPGFCYYENDPENGKKYGALYNFWAACSDKIAPKGWRVPTHEDQAELCEYLIASGYNYDGTREGSIKENKVAKSMTAKTDWDPDPVPGTAGHDLTTNNSSGFTALPTGSRWNDGSFHAMGKSVYWWSTTKGEGEGSHMSSIHSRFAKYGFNQHHDRSGFCIRLLRDADDEIPTDGLKLWFRADRGVTHSDNKVSQWDDQSGSGLHARTAGGQPMLVSSAIGGKPAIHLNGKGDMLQFEGWTPNGLTEMTMTIVCANTEFQPEPYKGGWDEGGHCGTLQSVITWPEQPGTGPGAWGNVILSAFQKSVSYRFGTGQKSNSNNWKRPASIGDAPTLTTATKDGATEKVFVDGELVWTQTDKLTTIKNTDSKGFIGRWSHGGDNSGWFLGNVAEIIVYTRALDDAERKQVEGYLKAKYFADKHAAH